MYDVIKRLREGFLTNGLKPPDYIILDKSEGMKFMSALGVDRVTFTLGAGHTATVVNGPNGELFARVPLYGIAILWPVK